MRSSSISKARSSFSPNSCCMAFNCSLRMNSRWALSSPSFTWDWILLPSSNTSICLVKNTLTFSKRFLISNVSKTVCFSSLLRLSREVTVSAKVPGSSIFITMAPNSEGRYGESSSTVWKRFLALEANASTSMSFSSTSGRISISALTYGSVAM